jgi:mycothiol S-conjugate amidase
LSEHHHATRLGSFTVLAVFAHPDDEIGVGSTLARYSDAGVRIVLACATRGEAATIYCADCAEPETLAEVRTQELACACKHLGVDELRWLDWPDGRVRDIPRGEAIRQVVELMREVHPTVVITHPENGLYPHPDHLAVWEIVRAAFDAAGDAGQYPDAGPACAAARLFTRAMPQSIFERTPGLSDFRVELNGQLLPFMGTPDAEIDVVMHVEPWTPRRMAAWDCHRSQHNPQGFTSLMPEAVRQDMAANEAFLLAAGSALPPGLQDDLFAGIEEGDTFMVERSADVNEGAPAELPQAGDAVVSEEYGRLLLAELSRHVTLAEVLRIYQHDPRETKQINLYRELGAGEQEIIYRLARALRRLDAGAGKTESDVAIIREARRRERPEPRREFLVNRMEVACGRLQDNARSTLVPEEREMWEELAVLAKSAVELLKE